MASKQLKELPTLSGKMGFDEKGDRVGDFYRIYKVNNAGKFEPRLDRKVIRSGAAGGERRPQTAPWGA